MIRGYDQLDVRHEINIIKSRQTSYNIAGDYTLADNDKFNFLMGVTSTTTMTITLPVAANNKDREVTVYQNIAAGKMIVDGNGAETINGATTTAITTQYIYVRVKCTGTEWIIIT